MNTIESELQDWFSHARREVDAVSSDPALVQIGTVTHIGDGVVTVVGLEGVRLSEILSLQGDVLALAVAVEANEVSCILLAHGEDVFAGAQALRTGEVVKVPVGWGFLGRVVDALGRPLDGALAPKADRVDPIERPAPMILDRDLVRKPLLTGVTVIDAMIPLGKGQRELIIGDRKTGKTAIAVDTVLNQKESGVICVYAAVGSKSSSVSDVVQTISDAGARDNCIFVVGEADAPPGLQWITPFTACTMAEYFRDQGRDVLLIIDDLTKHAIVHRQLSLLLRVPPGREAYPGDVFYLHARLLERSAQLAQHVGGGSLSALAIAETQDGDLTAYIPTNLISITDGQIFLEPKLFYEGHKPAINVGMSVSRVGGHSQAPAMKQMAEKLRLDYMQFLELEVFARFGALLDRATQIAIDHGNRIRRILVQAEHAPLNLADQIILLLAVSEGCLDDIDATEVDVFRERVHERSNEQCSLVKARLNGDGSLTDEDRSELLHLIGDVVADMSPSRRD